MPEGFYDHVVAELKRAGFAYWKNAEGSHETWRNPATGRILIVPRTLKSRHVLKDAGSARKV